MFVFHHHDPAHYDSAPVEPLLWSALFTALRDCAAVVCVSPYWATYLARHGVHARIIHNAFDTAVLDEVRGEDRADLRARFELPDDRILLYVGKAVHGKGVDNAHRLLGDDPRFLLVSTGNNTIGARTHHLGRLPYRDHLRVVRACDIGLFLSTLREGWSRCAAEAVLLELPCLTSGSAGLGDLADLTGRPVADPAQLANQVLERIRTPQSERTAAREHLATFDLARFGRAWTALAQATAAAQTSAAGTTREPDGAGVVIESAEPRWYRRQPNDAAPPTAVACVSLPHDDRVPARKRDRTSCPTAPSSTAT